MSRKFDDNLIGEAPAFMAVLEAVSAVAPLNRPVLLIGERGTGKELIAARLHYLSRRWDQPFVKLNCAALSETLLESELFGHEAGSFTGAKGQRKGRFELADNGTLFLDELANTSPVVQEKILRVIEYGEFERVGGQKPIRVDVRIIGATNEDLPALVEEGTFRADLLDRLAFDVLTLPPLCHRKEDIGTLADHFATRMAADLGLDLFAGFSESAMEAMENYRWPGNIRELKNVVERAVYRHDDPNQPVDEVTFDPFESPYRPRRVDSSADEPAMASLIPEPPFDFKELVKEYEIALIEKAMEFSKYNQRKAADAMDLTYHQLRGHLRKYELLEG